MSSRKDRSEEEFLGFGNASEDRKVESDRSGAAEVGDALEMKPQHLPEIAEGSERISWQPKPRGRMARQRTNRVNQLSLKLTDDAFHRFWDFAENFNGDGEETIQALLYYTEIGLKQFSDTPSRS